MRVHIVGSGDAFGSGGRFNTCLHLTTGSGAQILIDCSASSMTALAQGKVDHTAISTVLLTHFHGDHFGGLPFLLLNFQFVTGRTAPLRIIGPEGVQERIRTIMEAMFPGSFETQRAFELRFEEIAPGKSASIDGVVVEAFAMVHDQRAGPCQGYRLTENGKVFVYSGDTAWCPSVPAMAEGADVFLVECYSYDRRMHNHLDWQTLNEHLPELRARRIVLTHMNLDMIARDVPPPFEKAADGMVIML